MKRMIGLQKKGKASLRCFFFALSIMAYIFIFSFNVNAESCGSLSLLMDSVCPDNTLAEVVGLGLIHCCGYGCDYWCNNCTGGCRKPRDQQTARSYCAYKYDLCMHYYFLFAKECQRQHEECLKYYHATE